jgi:hypothetical protein
MRNGASELPDLPERGGKYVERHWTSEIKAYK